jgi:hypothetical protein
MDSTRTRPVAGALFAVNMLVATEGGGTFTFDELRQDLKTAGLINARVVRPDEGMNSIVVAEKPAGSFERSAERPACADETPGAFRTGRAQTT